MSDIRIKTYVLGMVSTNCYFIYKESDRKAVIIDPADNAHFILNKCREMDLTPEAILLTHGHFDHIMAVKDIVRAFPVKVYAGERETGLLEKPDVNLSWSYVNEQLEILPDVKVKDQEELDIIGLRWKVLATPGHTAGSVCYWIPQEEALFSGDTLFCESYGRTDLPTGNTSQILESLSQLFKLPENTVVYPGHGEATTIGHEKQYNPAAGL